MWVHVRKEGTWSIVSVAFQWLLYSSSHCCQHINCCCLLTTQHSSWFSNISVCTSIAWSMCVLLKLPHFLFCINVSIRQPERIQNNGTVIEQRAMSVSTTTLCIWQHVSSIIKSQIWVCKFINENLFDYAQSLLPVRCYTFCKAILSFDIIF